MPRSQFHPTDEQRKLVKSMAACGIPQEQISRHVGIRSPKTLRKHFRVELETGKADANYEMAKSLFQTGKNGNVEAQKFWLKCQAGWSEYPQFAAAPASLPPFVVVKDEGVQRPC